MSYRRIYLVRVLRLSALTAGVAACVASCGSDSGGASAEEAPPTEITVTSALIKRSDTGALITALRGTASPNAVIKVNGKQTIANADGRWAIRTDYDRRRAAIAVEGAAAGKSAAFASIAQPRRPKLRVSSSTGVTTTTDATLLKGRVSISKGALRGVHVTVNGAPATVSGSRWSKAVTVTKGTRQFSVKASKQGADAGTTSLSKTRKLSEAEKAAREAAREAARQAKEAARQARIAQRKATAAAKAAAREAKAAAQEAASACDANYAGACLKPDAGDYDCAGGSGDGPNYVDGPVDVVGSDPFDLDRDSDGVGCES